MSIVLQFKAITWMLLKFYLANVFLNHPGMYKPKGKLVLEIILEFCFEVLWISYISIFFHEKYPFFIFCISNFLNMEKTFKFSFCQWNKNKD